MIHVSNYIGCYPRIEFSNYGKRINCRSLKTYPWIIYILDIGAGNRKTSMKYEVKLPFYANTSPSFVSYFCPVAAFVR